MKKDALYYGSLLAFISFFLMVAFFIYDPWQSTRRSDPVKTVTMTQDSKGRSPRHDFSRYKTIDGKDGSEMVLIPEGPFQMGSQPGAGDLDEMPIHAAYVSAFYIDLREVTQAQFSVFTAEEGFMDPVVPVFEDDLSLLEGPDLPVVGLPWILASEYCKWADKRLPTEAEWEKAAGGEESLRWPWGNDSRDKAANIRGDEDGYHYLAAPGKFSGGRSPYGLYDMAGNVAEWVADWYDPNYYKEAPFNHPKGPEKGKFRVYRGGSWNESLVNARVAKRFAAAPHQTSAVIGFRCAMTPP